MTNEELIKACESALDRTKKWATDGWEMHFGGRQITISSLKEAEELPHNSFNRLEAIAYWKRVQHASEDAALWGQKALDALKKGDLKSADDSVYFCMIVEKPLREITPTWGPVYEGIKAARKAA